jgi:hypothetical protein
VSLRDALLDALEVPHAADSTSATHDVIRNTLRDLDPSLDVRATDYFAHSFVPDVVFSWGPGDARRERYVYLRFSVVDETFSHDVERLGAEGPLFLGMTDLDAPAPQVTGPALVAQTPAIEELVAGAERDARTRVTTGQIVRVGSGGIGSEQGHELADSTSQALRALDSLANAGEVHPEAITRALDVLAAILPEASLASVERNWQRAWISAGGDPFEFPGRTEWRPELLSLDELGIVLNAMLDAGREIDSQTWQRNAGHLDIEELATALSGDRRGGQMNSLAVALLPGWTAQWAWAERIEPEMFDTTTWMVAEQRIGLQAGGLRVLFANDGRHFKDKPASQILPDLPTARERLSGHEVLSVRLTSGRDFLTYGETSGVDTRPMVEVVTDLLAQDAIRRYRLQEAKILVPGTDHPATLEFDRLLVDLDKQPTAIARIARLALELFSDWQIDAPGARILLGE